MPTGVAPADVLPPDHQLGMQVPKGGSMCANCEYLVNPKTCGNKGFVAWNGSPNSPAPADEYCCDLYEPNQEATSGSDETGRRVKALQEPSNG